MRPSGSDGDSSVAAVIVNYEGGELLLDCIASLEAQAVAEIVLVDNGSTDGSAAAAVAQFPRVKLVQPGSNTGFAGGANLGARAARAELLLFLNPDIRLPPRSVAAMAARFADPRVGVLAPPLHVETSDSVEYGAVVDVIGSHVGLTTPAPPVYVSGCALMTRASLFSELGGFDDRYFMFVEDVDYCWRALLSGFEVTVPVIEPAWHFGGAATPGGYISSQGSLSSTLFRVVLRERNTLTMLLKCYGMPLAVVVTPFYIAQSLLTAVALAARGHRATARAMLGGFRWNLRELPRTLELRRRVQATRKVPDSLILRRMYRGVWKLHLLKRFGVPRVSEDEPAALDVIARGSGSRSGLIFSRSGLGALLLLDRPEALLDRLLGYGRRRRPQPRKSFLRQPGASQRIRACHAERRGGRPRTP